MSFDALAAAKAYANAAQAPLGSDKSAVSGPDFGKMVADAARETEQTLKTAETASAEMARGDAELVDVVTAVTAAETTLETVVTIRNEVIKAYQEVMRMPV